MFARRLQRLVAAGLIAGWMGMTAQNVPAQAVANVTLAWDPSPSSNIAGYRVYSGTISQAYNNVTDAGTNTTATVSSLLVGMTYYFAVTAYDSLGLESPFSQEISYSVPVLQSSPPTVGISIVGNQALLNGTGPIGYAYEVLVSSNLFNWTSIGSVTNALSGLFQFTDSTTNAPSRFYRLRQIAP
ncbi:MAG TPA: fibronectin type III domain-containing protein [Verrucomicrobiae bacterium]|nr:fibronectin type III domain-containing protein [Verrucomicrobiae bacterium]